MPSILTGRILGDNPKSVAVTNASTTVVAANDSRVGIILTNLASGTIYLAFGTNSAILNGGVVLLPAGGSWSMDDYTYTKEAIQGIAHSNNSQLAVQEFLDRN